MPGLLTRMLGGRGAPPPAFTVPKGERIYAVGDVHGQLAPLRALWALIEDDIAARPGATITEIYLGDYIDRGPDSAGVLDALANRRPPGRSLRFLRGNHEDYLIEFLDAPMGLKPWAHNGAVTTLASYGVPLNPVSIDEMAAHEAFAGAFPEAHRAFLERLERWVVIGGYLFVHAGIRPGRPLEAQTARDLAGIREAFLNHKGKLPYRVVHGHTPVREPEALPYRVNVDTGAFATGRLSCAVIEGTTVRFLSTTSAMPR